MLIEVAFMVQMRVKAEKRRNRLSAYELSKLDLVGLVIY